MVKPGARLLDVAESAEKFLKDKGFGLAFPINLSVNEQAAHYTPSVGDERIFTENDLVKIDFGAERNGLLGDGAITVDLSGKHREHDRRGGEGARQRDRRGKARSERMRYRKGDRRDRRKRRDSYR